MISASARRVFESLLTFLIVAVFPLSSDAQTPEQGTPARRTIQAARLRDTEHITVDGRLDEEVWQRAVPAGDFIQIARAEALERSAPAPFGVLVTNPPYGVRLDDQQRLAAFYPQLGDALKRRFTGWTAHLLTADLRLAKLIGLKPSRRTVLYNGALECRLFAFPIVAGSMRDQPPPAMVKSPLT